LGLEVINKFLIRVFGVGHTELELSLFGLENHGLVLHPSDHVEGCPRLAPEGQLQEVVLNACFERFL